MTASRQDAKLVLLLCLALLSCLAEGRGRGGRPAGPPQTIFNVLTYGAKPDGKTEGTQAFHDAWRAACQFNGRPRLLIPAGVFLVGQLIFSGPCISPITVQVRGTVKATTDTSKWKDAEWIAFEKITGFNLNGGGTFDGQGQAVWGNNECNNRAHCASRSVNIKFRHIANAKVGRITSLNPKGFHMCINTCQNFRAKKLKIIAPAESPNTDGMHISHSTNVNVMDSIISTGDDCVSIIQGDTNVTVSNVHCGPGHGISVGSLGKYKNEEDVHNIFVRNCTLANTDNGVRIKTWRGAPPSSATNINFEDIIMENVKNPIMIDQEYCAEGPNCRGNQPSQVKIDGATFRNIRGTSRSKNAVRMKCSPASPCQNVQVHDINLKFIGAAPNAVAEPVLSECSNVKVGARGIQIPSPCV